MCMRLFEGEKNNFRQNYRIFDLDIFEIRLQYGVERLCNQLRLGILGNKFETLQRCYKNIEIMHVTFCKRKNNF